MKICVIGAGAIGGLLAARLARAGEHVSVVARGATLAALRDNGLTLIEENGDSFCEKVAVTSRMGDLGAQDLIILGMKAHQVAAVAGDLAMLYHSDTVVIPAQNGLPWWYFYKHGGSLEGRRLESVDPGGLIADKIPAARVVATVVYPAAEIVRPGVIRHIEGLRFSLAELDGSKSPRVERISETMRAAGFKAPVTSDIRAEIWTKLWGNLSFNPISALTHATLEAICRDEASRALAATMMREAQTVGEALGVRFRIPLEKRIAGAEAVGAHKTSMLQDIEAGRPLEIDALLGAVLELGAMTGVSTPSCQTVYALVKLLDRTIQDQRGRLRLETT